MRVLASLFSISLLIYQVQCEATVAEFFQNIPGQISSAWRGFADVLRQPIKVKRLGSTRKLKERYRATTSPQGLTVTQWRPVQGLTPPVKITYISLNPRNYSKIFYTFHPLSTTDDYGSLTSKKYRKMEPFGEIEDTTLAYKQKLKVPLLPVPKGPKFDVIQQRHDVRRFTEDVPNTHSMIVKYKYGALDFDVDKTPSVPTTMRLPKKKKGVVMLIS